MTTPSTTPIKMASLEPAKMKYKLSSELVGHSGDVRAVDCLVDDDSRTEYIVTASRDETAIVWLRLVGQRNFSMSKRIAQHNGYVSALCVIPADQAAGRDKRELENSW